MSKNAFKAWGYCTKEDTRVEGPWTHGEMPKPPKRGAKDSLEFNLACLEAGPSTMIRSGQLNMKDYIKVVQAVNLYKLHNADNKDRNILTNYWFMGETGAGKSREAKTRFRAEYGVHYDKMLNKWWDGYQGEKVVILDDITPDHCNIAHHLLRWLDHYSFNAEVKGGTINIRPEIIIVTSNYTIEEVFGKKDIKREIETGESGYVNQPTLSALRRRLKIETWSFPFDQ